MTNIKTVILSGTEIKIDGLAGQNTVIKNLGKSAIYASASPGITEGADGVVEISADGVENLYGTNGTVYLLGSGKVQLTGTDYADLNYFSAVKVSSGSTGIGITKEDIDSIFNGSTGSSSNKPVITKEQIDGLFK